MAENPDLDRAGQNSDAWFSSRRFAALLGLLLLACFPRVLAGFETFFFRDYAAFGYPLAAYHRESFWHGEMPLWNPYNNCGLPFTAQWNTLTLYPLSLFYLLFPLPWSLGVFCLGHLFLAGLGMYFLARRWTGNGLAAAIAGIAFAWNGLTWNALMWPNNIAALGWMPWVVLAAERAWREGGRQIILAAFAGAMQMLAGAPEIILQTWLVVGCLWLASCFQPQVSRGKLLLRLMIVGLLVTGLAAAQLLPFLDLLAHSQRNASFGDSEWAMPATGWANYLVALFHFSEPAGQGVRMQPGQYWTSSYYAGVGVVALALLATWRARQRRVWLLAALALFSMTLALGSHGPLYPVLKKIAPQIGFMRFPIKFIVLATFCLPLLAAEGVAWLRALPAGSRPMENKKLLWLGAALGGLIVLIACLGAMHPQGEGDFARTARSAVRGAVFLALILGCVGILQAKPELKTQRIFQVGLLALFWLDISTHSASLSPTVSASIYQPDSMREELHWDEVRPGISRARQGAAAFAKIYHGAVDNPANDFLGRRLTLSFDLNLLDHFPKVDGFYSLYLREVDAVVTPLSRATNDLPGLEDFLGISRVSDPANPMEWVARKSFSPLVTGGQQPVFADDAAALKALFDPAFDGRGVVLLPPEAKTAVRATNRADVKFVSTNFSAQRVGIQVEAAAPAMVVVAQAYYHPWRAYVDGAPTTLWRANYAFQALEVPAGTHRVQLVYEDKQFWAGSVISLATLLGCVAAWVWPRKKSAVAISTSN